MHLVTPNDLANKFFVTLWNVYLLDTNRSNVIISFQSLTLRSFFFFQFPSMLPMQAALPTNVQPQPQPLPYALAMHMPPQTTNYGMTISGGKINFL